MGLLSFLTSNQHSKPKVFEKELLQLELRITHQQNKLDRIQKTLNSSLTHFSIYTLSIWFIYSLLWFSRQPILHFINKLTPNPINSNCLPSYLLLPVILIPIGLQSFRWIFQAYYRRLEEIELIQLRLIKQKLRDKVEEVKNKTAYYSTKELLDRYDDQAQPPHSLSDHLSPHHPTQNGHPTMSELTSQALLRQRNRVASSSTVKSNHPIDQIEPPIPHSPVQSLNPPLPLASPTSQHPPTDHTPHSASPTPPPSSLKRGWADRVAEALLGNDEASPESKYALICIKCFAHNGLVRKEELDLIKYICPKCGTFNPSRNPRSIQINGGGEVRRESFDREEEEEEQKAKEKEDVTQVKHAVSMMKGYGSTRHLGAGGRKSLGGPVTSTPTCNPSLNLTEKRRAVSSANPGTFVSTCASMDETPSLESDRVAPTDAHHVHENLLSSTPSSHASSTIPHTTPSKPSNSRSKSKNKKS